MLGGITECRNDATYSLSNIADIDLGILCLPIVECALRSAERRTELGQPSGKQIASIKQLFRLLTRTRCSPAVAVARFISLIVDKPNLNSCVPLRQSVDPSHNPVSEQLSWREVVTKLFSLIVQ